MFKKIKYPLYALCVLIFFIYTEAYIPTPFPTICKEDHRSPTTLDLPLGRLFNTRNQTVNCTAFYLSSGVFATAAHCDRYSGGFDELHFQIPLSDCSGKFTLPEKKNRFKVDRKSIRKAYNPNTSEDWLLFRLEELSPASEFDKKNLYFKLKKSLLSDKKKLQVSVAGYGRDEREPCKKLNYTLQITTAEGYLASWFYHFCDTHIGNSGSPVFIRTENGDLYVLGIHAGGGCPNIATSFQTNRLSRVLQDMGVTFEN